MFDAEYITWMFKMLIGSCIVGGLVVGACTAIAIPKLPHIHVHVSTD